MEGGGAGFFDAFAGFDAVADGELDEGFGVDGAAVDADFEVEVCAVGVAGGSDGADFLAHGDLGAGADVGGVAGEVGVSGGGSVGVGDVDDIAVGVVACGVGDGSGGGGADGGAVGGHEVDAGVVAGHAAADRFELGDGHEHVLAFERAGLGACVVRGGEAEECYQQEIYRDPHWRRLACMIDRC